jgi:hypothetical protein
MRKKVAQQHGLAPLRSLVDAVHDEDGARRRDALIATYRGQPDCRAICRQATEQARAQYFREKVAARNRGVTVLLSAAELLESLLRTAS